MFYGDLLLVISQREACFILMMRPGAITSRIELWIIVVPAFHEGAPCFGHQPNLEM